MTRCAACSRRVEGFARFCDQCGAAQGTVTMPASLPAELARHQAAAPAGRPRWDRAAGIAALLLLSAAGAALGASWMLSAPQATADELQTAVRNAVAQGAGPGSDPICVANGLAYDQLPVNVQPTNTVTVSWMNTLVSAGLYEAPEKDASGSFLSQPILVYRPLPALAQWAGARRLCIARAVRLYSVANLGQVDQMRLRGKRYAGVPADVVWTLSEPAPWLARPDVAEAFARELPTWRSARWHTVGKSWRLSQRKHFFLVDDRWVTSETAERLGGAQSDAAAPL